MKKLIISIGLLASCFSLAHGAENCDELIGGYTCDLDGEGVSLNIDIDPETSNFEGVFTFSDGYQEGESYILDGKERVHSTGTTTYIAKCVETNKVLIHEYKRFGGHGLVEIVKFSLFDGELDFSSESDEGGIALNCNKL